MHGCTYTRDGHGAGSGIGLHFSDPDLNFWKKDVSGFGMNGMVYIYPVCMIKTKVAFLEGRLLSSQSELFKSIEKALIG